MTLIYEDLTGELSILVVIDQNMPTKVDILSKNYLFLQFYFYCLVILDCLILDNDTGVNVMTNSSQFMEIPNFELGTHFSNLTLQNGPGEAIYLLKSEFLYENIYLTLNNLLCYVHPNTGCFQIANTVRWTLTAAFSSHRRHFLLPSFWEWPQGCHV